jgi:hypothetical protein
VAVPKAARVTRAIAPAAATVAPAVAPAAAAAAPPTAAVAPLTAAVAPAETKPAETKPAESRRVETKPAEPKLAETRAGDRGTATFWPSAYDDVFGYVVSSVGYGNAFWLRGYAEVIEAMFAPSVARAPRDKRGRAGAAIEPANSDVPSAPACGTPSSGAMIQRIEQIVRPIEAQRQALHELGNALQAAAERVGAVCGMEGAGGPNARLDMMWRRLRAMRQAVTLVRAPLRNFYETLTQEQQARLDAAAGGDPGARVAATREASDRFVRTCSDSTRMPEWPLASIAQTVKLDQDQRPMLELLTGTSMHYAHQLRASCSAAPAPITSTERLDAVDQRLTDIVYAVTVLRGMLTRFYNSLTEEQRARFDAMAPVTRPADRHRAELQ